MAIVIPHATRSGDAPTLNGLSRRHVMAAVVCAMTPFAGAARAQTTPSPDGGTANLPARNDTAQRLTVEVRINGAGPYSFVVDTGAERTVIADDLAVNLGLARGHTVQVDGLARRISAETANVRELAFGPFKRRNLNLPILPRAMLGCDGYLGLDAINGSRVTFDFKNHVLRIEQPVRGYMITGQPSETTTDVQASGIGGRLRVGDCLVDGVRATAFIDSGAEISVGNPSLLAALNRRKPVGPDLGVLVLTGVTGGQIEGRVKPVRLIKLQALDFTDCSLVIADAPNFSTWGLTNAPAVLIGMDFLRQFGKVSIDYRDKVIRFDLARVSGNKTI